MRDGFALVAYPAEYPAGFGSNKSHSSSRYGSRRKSEVTLQNLKGALKTSHHRKEKVISDRAPLRRSVASNL
jgi:hypothetical protein